MENEFSFANTLLENVVSSLPKQLNTVTTSPKQGTLTEDVEIIRPIARDECFIYSST